MTPAAILAGLLALAVALGWARLLLWQRAAPDGGGAAGWRLALLLLLQPVAAGLLWLTLMPPPVTGPAGRLTVATRNAGSAAMLAAGAPVILLPEARGRLGGARAPDLGTALRQHPGTRRLTILGDGLEPRDLAAARGLAIDFTPPARPRGLVALATPAPVAPGAALTVGGEAAGLGGGWAELIDPSGARIARQRLGPDGRFRLAGAVRVPGPATFTVRLRDGGGAIVEDALVPVRTEAQTGLRVLLLAGAPGPEPKFLRRWATDAGVAMRARMSAGGGIALGDGAITLTPATLAATDLAVVDERGWAALSLGERAALAGAVRGGMGLMLRAAGPLPAGVATQWRALGFAIAGKADEVAVSIAPGLPLHALSLTVAAPDSVPLLRDGKGLVLGRWRALGRGRVGVWTVTDSFTLALSGHADRYGELWSGAFATLARAAAVPDAAIDQPAWAGARMTLCGLSARADIADPLGAVTAPIIDPAGGPASCAAYWPTRAGWHRLRLSEGGKAHEQPFYVLPADALPAMRATMARDATLRLAAQGFATGPATAVTRPGSPWPWFAAWLAVSALLWWLERARIGRGGSRVTPPRSP